MRAVIENGAVPGHFVKDAPGTRRYTEGTTNYKQFFKVGIIYLYPNLDSTILEKAFDRPDLLVDNSFFQQIQKVNLLC